jgi:hypothetical protein
VPIPVKIVLGLMALWGVVYSFVALSGGDYALVPGPGSGREAVSGLESFIIHLHALNALAILLIFAFIALNLQRLPVAHRVGWVFGFLFFYPIAMPAFWWLHVWRAPRRPPPPPDLAPPQNP